MSQEWAALFALSNAQGVIDFSYRTPSHQDITLIEGMIKSGKLMQIGPRQYMPTCAPYAQANPANRTAKQRMEAIKAKLRTFTDPKPEDFYDDDEDDD